MLSPGYILAALAGAVVLYIPITSIRSWYRLRHVPGPRLAHWSYLFITKTTLSGRMWEIYRDVSARYGSLVRIGPNELITDDPELIRRMSAARSTYTRSSWYALNKLDPYHDSMFSLRDTAAHDKLKAKTAAAYSGKENLSIEDEIDYVLAEMVEKIRDKYLHPEGKLVPLDFARMAQYFTLDSITKVAFGEEFGFLSNEKDMHGYLGIIEDIAPMMQLSTEVPILASMMSSPLVLSLAGPSPKDQKGIGKLMGVAREIVARRFTPDSKDQMDMLGAFVRHGMTQRECETEAIFQVVAGSDTTATAIRATMLYIMTTPRVYRKLQKEIDDAIAAGRVSKPIRNSEAPDLPYLQAVIYEGIRVHPPFVGIPLKEVPPQGDWIDGMFIPGGTRIAPSNWALLHKKSVFGEDAELFRPERWTEVELTKNAEMRRVVELVFGYGRWVCAGKTLAFMELNKVFVELLRQYDFQLVYPFNPWDSVNHNLFLQKNMWVKVTDRNN